MNTRTASRPLSSAVGYGHATASRFRRGASVALNVWPARQPRVTVVRRRRGDRARGSGTRLGWRRVATAVVVVVVGDIASVEVTHAAASTVAAAGAAEVALRGTPVNNTDSTGSGVSEAFGTLGAAAAGDLLIASLSYRTPGLADIANTAPAGWTKIPGELFDVSTTTGSHLVVAVKAAVGGTESGTWGFATLPASPSPTCSTTPDRRCRQSTSTSRRCSPRPVPARCAPTAATGSA